MINPIVQGWINYYGRFYKSLLYPLFRRLNDDLARWASRKYRRLHHHHVRAVHSFGSVADATRHSFRTGGWEYDPDGRMMGAG